MKFKLIRFKNIIMPETVCTKCNGRKWYEEPGFVKCRNHTGEKCQTCKGLGREYILITKDCETCYGKGKIRY